MKPLQVGTFDCLKCQGLCCITTSRPEELFPGIGADMGVACRQLDEACSCRIHECLSDQQPKCAAFDCSGAGNAMSEVLELAGISNIMMLMRGTPEQAYGAFLLLFFRPLLDAYEVLDWFQASSGNHWRERFIQALQGLIACLRQAAKDRRYEYQILARMDLLLLEIYDTISPRHRVVGEILKTSADFARHRDNYIAGTISALGVAAEGYEPIVERYLLALHMLVSHLDQWSARGWGIGEHTYENCHTSAKQIAAEWPEWRRSLPAELVPILDDLGRRTIQPFFRKAWKLPSLKPVLRAFLNATGKIHPVPRDEGFTSDT